MWKNFPFQNRVKSGWLRWSPTIADPFGTVTTRMLCISVVIMIMMVVGVTSGNSLIFLYQIRNRRRNAHKRETLRLLLIEWL